MVRGVRGLQAGDVITAVNGKAVSDVAQTRAALAGLKEGQAVNIGYRRAGKNATASLKAAAIAPQMVINRERHGTMDRDGRGEHGFAFATRWPGLTMAEVNPQLGRYFGASAGVLVLSPKAEFPQLQAGDVIVTVDGKAVGNASYDRSQQRFANVRAARDAEIRLARSLAEQIRVRISAALASAG